MATTTPDEIWTPDLGDKYALTTHLAAMADSIQDALTGIRESAGYRIGTEAQRIAATATSKLGDRWISTNSSPAGRGFFHNGSSWLLDSIPRTTWTPTWNNFITGGSVVTASYSVSGGRCFGDISVTVGSGFAMNSSTINFVPPVPQAFTSSVRPVGTGIYQDAGSGNYSGPLMTTGGNIQLMTDMGTFLSGVNGVGNPFGWSGSNGDSIHLTFNYAV